MSLQEGLAKAFDPYERQARLYPGLLVVAPAAVTFVCLVGPQNLMGTAVAGVLIACGVAYVLGRVARDAGKRLQDECFARWGGAPTTQVMRHRDATIDVHTKARYHEALSRGLGKALPSPAEEQADPAAADEYFRAASTWLIGQTRDAKAFPLVLKENTAFGFQRNALGLRTRGIVVSVLCVLLMLVRILLLGHFSRASWLEEIQKVGAANLLGLSVSLGFVGMWTFFISEGALKRTAFAYSLRLLESCDRLATPEAEVSRKPREGS